MTDVEKAYKMLKEDFGHWHFQVGRTMFDKRFVSDLQKLVVDGDVLEVKHSSIKSDKRLFVRIVYE